MKYDQNQPRNTQSGNVLWFILITIALLGALTMVLSHGGSQVDQTGNVEQNSIKTSALLRYTKGIEQAISQLKLDGVSESDISFQNDKTTVNYTNASCTSSACRIFGTGGAGLAYQNFPDINDGSDWIFTGANNVGTTAGPIGTTADGSGNDLVMLLPNVNTALCKQINKDLGVGTAGTLPSDDTGVLTTAFTGSYPTGALNILDGDATPFELDGKPAGCFIDTAANPDVTYFYYVVLAR